MKGIFLNQGNPATIMPVPVIYITVVLLFIAILPMPADFYALLRIVAAGTFAWGAYRNFGKKLFLLPLAYTVLAILFNPVMEINLAKEIAIPIDLLAAVLLLSTKNYIVE
jgi:hypothetical protein